MEDAVHFCFPSPYPTNASPLSALGDDARQAVGVAIPQPVGHKHGTGCPRGLPQSAVPEGCPRGGCVDNAIGACLAHAHHWQRGILAHRLFRRWGSEQSTDALPPIDRCVYHIPPSPPPPSSPFSSSHSYSLQYQSGKVKSSTPTTAFGELNPALLQQYRRRQRTCSIAPTPRRGSATPSPWPCCKPSMHLLKWLGEGARERWTAGRTRVLLLCAIHTH